MATKVETLRIARRETARPEHRTAPRIMKAVADWFRNGQLAGYSSTELSRQTGGRV